MELKNESNVGFSAEISIIPVWAWLLAVIGFAAMQAEGFVTLALPLPRFLRRRKAPARACAHAVAERDVRAA